MHSSIQTARSLLSVAVLALSLPAFAQENAGPPTEEPAKPPAPAGALLDLSEQWGVQVIGLHLTAAGYMLDFRYRVTDPAKAAPIFLRKNQPALIDQASGHKFTVARPATVGPLRSSQPPQAGRTYFMLFGNPGGFVKPGNKVTIEVGDFKVKDLEVQ
jgi:hypothetical protein